MSQQFKLAVCAPSLAVGFALTVPVFAEPAKEPKPKKPVVARNAAQSKSNYWGTDKFPAGPLYNGQEYLGDDPDPFIRFQLRRDLSGRYGGGDN